MKSLVLMLKLCLHTMKVFSQLQAALNRFVETITCVAIVSCVFKEYFFYFLIVREECF